MPWIVVDGGSRWGWLMTMMSVSGWMFLLVPAHPGCPGQNLKSRKTVVCVCVYFLSALNTIYHIRKTAYYIYALKLSHLFASNVIFCHSWVANMEICHKNGRNKQWSWLRKTTEKWWNQRGSTTCFICIWLILHRLCYRGGAAKGHITWACDQLVMYHYSVFRKQ